MQQNKVGEQKLYKLFGRFSLFLALSAFTTLLCGASFSEFNKSQSDALTTYLDKKDEKFYSYLISNWEEYSSTIAPSLYAQPKPEKIQRTRDTGIKERGPIVHISKKNSQKIMHVNNDSNQTMLIKIVQPKKVHVKKDIELNFFGTHLGFTIPSGIRQAKFYPQNKKGISNFFNVVIGTEFEKLIEEIKKESLSLNLNDWGKYLLITKISEKIFASQDDSRLLRWFIFNKLGYSVRVGLAKKHVLIMYESKKTIYDTPMYTINSNNFYIISAYAKGSSGKLFTYKQSYPHANKLLDLSMNSLPNLEKKIQTKLLIFKINRKKYTLPLRYNQNLIDFMATYPQADYDTFFNAPLSEESYEDVINGLRKYINGKKSSNAINFVLHFVQNAFAYEVDSSQFGREKVMFAQETLYYKKSDCEDRAILFAKLAKDMFNIGVVGVRYSDHMATALYIPLEGDSIRVYGKKYVLADPTYINASIGQSMSKYKSKKPKGFIYLTKKRLAR